MRKVVVLLMGVFLSQQLPSIINKLMDWKAKRRGQDYSIIQKYSKKSYFFDVFLYLLVLLLAVEQRSDYMSLFLSVIYLFLMLLIVRIDLIYRIIPNEMVITLSIVHLFKSIYEHRFLQSLQSFGFMFLCLVLSILISKKFYGFQGVGAGDVKLLLAFSLALNVQELQSYLFILALVLMLYFLWARLIQKRRMFDTFAMGPYLVIAYVIQYLRI